MAGSLSVNSPIKLPPVIDGVNFKLVTSTPLPPPRKGFKLTAQCLHCHTDKYISGDTSSSANFLDHLKRLHPNSHVTYLNKRKAAEDLKQPSLKQFCTGVTKGKQKTVDKSITKYIVRSMQPLSTVDDPNFIAMVRELVNDSSVRVLAKSKLVTLIQTEYKSEKMRIKKEIDSTDFLCLTADVWTSRSRSFLGVTCHHIDEDLQRISNALACTRFKGKHSYDKIAEKLNIVMSQFGISMKKAVCIVTDNGSNFCKAIREFAVIEVVEEDETVQEDSDLDEGEEEDREEEFPTVSEIIETRPANGMTLPSQFRCASHTLNLVATADTNSISNKQIYNKAIGKCTKLWNLSNSSKQAEKMKEICGKILQRPGITRWNSLYDSVSELLQVEDKINEVCQAVDVPVFSTLEFQFLRNFVKVSQPLAISLDKLQGETGLYMGALLPTLLKLKQKLSAFADDDGLCKTAKAFAAAYSAGLDKRFETLMNIDASKPSELVVATITHPFFRLLHIPQEFHADLKKSVISLAKTMVGTSATSQSIHVALDAFYDDDLIQNATEETSVEVQFHYYFSDETRDLSVLNRYPAVRKVFLRYNTALPSSAPVERLFSYGGLILTTRRSRLSDKRFEQLVFLKCNGVYKDRTC